MEILGRHIPTPIVEVVTVSVGVVALAQGRGLLASERDCEAVLGERAPVCHDIGTDGIKLYASGLAAIDMAGVSFIIRTATGHKRGSIQ